MVKLFMRLIQHKNEAYWFYRFLSIFYDKHVNPFFWNEPMRKKALKMGKLSNELKVIDVGAGTGFATEGIVQNVNPKNVVMLDQSPHQLDYAEKKPELAKVKKIVGDAEYLPFPNDYFDRYVSAGSIEYWPNPQKGISESYRVIKKDGIALMIGPIEVRNRILRLFSNMWMLFPTIEQYFRWYKNAGFSDIKYKFISPEWVNKDEPYAIVISGVKNQPGLSPIHTKENKETSYESMGFIRRMKFFYRFVLGSFFGTVFVPVAIIADLNYKKKTRKKQSKSK